MNPLPYKSCHVSTGIDVVAASRLAHLDSQQHRRREFEARPRLRSLLRDYEAGLAARDSERTEKARLAILALREGSQ